MYVEVAVNAPIATTLTYHIPPELEGRLQPGHLVTVPLRDGRAYAVVVALSETTPVPDTRPVGEPVDPEPALTAVQLELARWLSANTLAPLIDCVRLMLPPGLARRADVLVELVEPAPPAGELTGAQEAVLEALRARGPLRGRQLMHVTGKVDWRNVVAQLVRRGLVRKQALLPAPAVRPKLARVVHLTATPAQIAEALAELERLPRSALYRAILDLLQDENEPLEASWVYAQTGCELRHLRRLEEMGLVSFEEEEVWRDPLAGKAFVPTAPLAMTRDQAQADEAIRASVQRTPELSPEERVRGAVFLLHGVTGSGKTEIYLNAVAEALAQGRCALVLVPEIALTPQTVRRFAARFPAQVAIVHSLLGLGERYDTWRRIRAGLVRVIVGARSALFVPARDLGVIVLDEEHDGSYKQSAEEGGMPFPFPAYHAREVAVQLGRLTGAPVILGSATPDLTTYYRARRGQYRLLELPQRILGHQHRLEELARQYGVSAMRYRTLQDGPSYARFIELPPVQVVDMRAELKAGVRGIFSRALRDALEAALGRGEQAILFLNRRGTSTFVLCRDCGAVLKCKRCDTPYTYHAVPQARGAAGPSLVCHHCNRRAAIPSACPACGSEHIRYFGLGTEQVEQAVHETFPDARTLRWDRDTARSPEAHAALLGRFVAGQADVLVGTQMIAKGLDLPLVTVVGVISADTALFLPDYRSGERTFQLLTQVAGRAGRGLLGGQVVLQTYNPEHYAIQAAARHDYETFYRQELAYRREHYYPPFRRLARLLIRDTDQRRAEAAAQDLAATLQREIERSALGLTDLLGPAPCFFTRVAGRYRWQILVRSPDPLKLLGAVEIPAGWAVDLDPVTTL